MTKGETIAYAINKECSQFSLVEWCEDWGVSIEDFQRFLDLGTKAFGRQDGTKSEPKHGKWVKMHGYATPGGDPVWCCSECGKGIHVYGVEHKSYGSDIADHQWVTCPNCGTIMDEEDHGWKG